METDVAAAVAGTAAETNRSPNVLQTAAPSAAPTHPIQARAGPPADPAPLLPDNPRAWTHPLPDRPQHVLLSPPARPCPHPLAASRAVNAATLWQPGARRQECRASLKFPQRADPEIRVAAAGNGLEPGTGAGIRKRIRTRTELLAPDRRKQRNGGFAVAIGSLRVTFHLDNGGIPLDLSPKAAIGSTAGSGHRGPARSECGQPFAGRLRTPRNRERFPSFSSWKPFRKPS